MKRYTFDTFEVRSDNRQAHDVCRAVADLEPVSPLPIILLGEERTGKTHLLYSIVNRIRDGGRRTGLAYITARDFPEQVRALIKNPAPVERAPSAVLLVDQVDQFSTYLRELEAVVRLFLQNGHYVVLSTTAHPRRLQNLTDGLRVMLDGGQIITLQSVGEPDIPPSLASSPSFVPVSPSVPSIPVPTPVAIDTSVFEERIAALEADAAEALVRIDALTAERDEAVARAETTEKELAELSEKMAEMESSLALLPDLQARIENANAKYNDSQDDVIRLQTLCDEREALAGHAKLFEQQLTLSEEEKAILLNENAMLQSENEALQRDIMTLENTQKMAEGEKSLLENAKRLHEDERQLHLAEVKALRERMQALEHDASVARTESEQATLRASSIIENDSSMRESVDRERATFEAERAAWARAEAAYRDRVASLERVAAMHNVQESQMGHLRDRAERSETELESLRSRYEQSLRDFDQMLAQARREASDTAVARGSVMTELLQAQGENDALRGQVQELLGRLRGVEEEYENLRSGALAHSAMIGHSPDEEQRNARVYEAFDLSRQTCSAAGARLGMLQGQFRDLADVVGKLAERLTSTAAISITNSGNARRSNDMEPITVEPAPQAALPDPETIADDFDDLREEAPEEVLAPDIAADPLNEDPYEFEMDEDAAIEPEMPAETPKPAPPAPAPPAPQPAPAQMPRRTVPTEQVATPDYDNDEDDDDEPRFFLKPRPAISNDPPAPKPPIRTGEDSEFILS